MNKSPSKPCNSISKNRTEKKYRLSRKLCSKTSYVNGKEHGLDTLWREDGTKWWEKMWKNGKQQGLEIWWYEDGAKKWEEMWKNGKLHGMETWRYEDGAKQLEIYQIEGHECARIDWDENGNVAKADFLNLTPIKNKQSAQKFPTPPPVDNQLRELPKKLKYVNLQKI